MPGSLFIDQSIIPLLSIFSDIDFLGPGCWPSAQPLLCWRTSDFLSGFTPLVTVFVSPRDRVAQLYPQAPATLLVASYDMQGVRWDYSSSWSPHRRPKNLQIKIYKTVILPVVLYGCKTWSLTLREEHRLRVSENSVLRICEPERKTDHGENCIMMSFITCILYRILLG
jgi:hypothetical protein